MRQLYTDIFTSYQPSILPNSDFSAPLQITLSPYLMTITQFQEVEETLDVALGLICTWVDDGFSWTPSSYGNAEYIIVPHTDVWTPKFVLVNSVETYEPLAGDNDIFATIYSNGTMSIVYGDVLSSKLTIVISGITAAVTIYIAALYHREPHVKMNSFWKFIGTRLPWSRRHTPVRPLTKNGAKGDIISSSIEESITWQEVCHALDTLMMVILYANIFIINCAFLIAVA
ncbi:unnamed protein product [Mytilus edulis]|uniref:Neurotransmitter-gated ion-channel ligand-binding domain-containing protein n=1 Tax=Mytilus edulis TaxID=6550 RepID=A0A8S3VHU9_MYTED|nr:unnamed protein product [Mytilus edulis]